MAFRPEFASSDATVGVGSGTTWATGNSGFWSSSTGDSVTRVSKHRSTTDVETVAVRVGDG